MRAPPTGDPALQSRHCARATRTALVAGMLPLATGCEAMIPRVPLIYGFWFDGQALFGMGYGDNAVDMRVDLIFTTTWTESSGETCTAPLAVMGWTVPDVPLGKPLEVHQSAGWLPFVPPSASLGAAGATTYGRGLFVVEALVTEQDDLSPAYIADRATLVAYVDDLLGLMPNPGP
jgi:hypothetical protein